MTTIDFFSPFARTSITLGMETNLSIISFPSATSASMSMSPMVSTLLLKEPPTSILFTPSVFFSSSTISMAIGSATPKGSLSFPFLAISIALIMFSSVFSPNPSNLAILPSLAAVSSSSIEFIPSSLYSLIAFFGPNPWRSIISLNPFGIFFFNFSYSLTLPVKMNSSVFFAIASPTPGISIRAFIPPFLYTSSIGSERVSIALAAFLYAIGFHFTSCNSSMSAIA